MNNLENNVCHLISLTDNVSDSLANYSHLIPVFFGLALAILVFFKAKNNILSKIFMAFIVSFSLWLVGDLITWISNNYYLVYAVWAPLDYIEVVFYVLGLYFVLAFVHKKDVSILTKILLFSATIYPLIVTLTKSSIIGFNHFYCEAVGNTFLAEYKIIIELVILIIILVYLLAPFFKNKLAEEKKPRLIVLGPMFLFLAIFGITAYLASVTAYYELSLYALFVVPIFLVATAYSIFSLDIFNIKLVSTYFIVIGFIILAGTQLFFVTDDTDRLLSIVTVFLSIALSFILFKNLKKETNQRLHIEKLSKELEESALHLEQMNLKLENANDKLKDLDKLKTEFISLASHQLKSPLTAIKGYTSMVLEGDYGPISEDVKSTLDRVFQSSKNLTIIVEDLLNVAKIEQGGMKYEMAPFSLREVADTVAKDFTMVAESKGLKMILDFDEADNCMVNGDKEKIRQVVINLLDNSIKYTKVGEIKVSVKRNPDNITFAVKDTGVGMTKEIKETLFDKFARGDGAKMNTSGSGLGLYLVKQIVNAHHGHIYVESDGPNKGSTFTMELYPAKEVPKEETKVI